VKGRAGPDGKWKVRFPGLAKNTSFDINITTGEGEEKVIRNAVAGQVWLCSGQSNMGMPVSASDVKEKLKDSDVHEIRFFLAQNDPSATELHRLTGHWVICTTQTIGSCSAVGLSFAWNLHQHLRQPVGLIINAVGGTPIESWTPLTTVKEKAYNIHVFQERAQWQRDRNVYEKEYQLKLKNREIAVQQAREEGRPLPPKIYPPFALRENWNPGSLYNSLVCPVRDFVFKGIIWYQGESNANYPFVYRYQLADMIRCWRKLFNKKKLPFYIIQLPDYQCADDWAVIRESQASVGSLNDTRLIVTLGLGDSLNIHPVRKMEVGRRVSLQVLRKEYGYDLVASGPRLKKMEITGEKIRLSFDCSGSLIKSSDGRPLRNMEISDDGLVFFPAQVRIDRNTLLVWSDKIKHPGMVRYAWKNVPEPINFVNQDGLPAPPFFSGGKEQHILMEKNERKNNLGSADQGRRKIPQIIRDFYSGVRKGTEAGPA
ncbi:MAG TPA: sialate O-acetylesterase, partial [Puia sp.]